MENQNIIKYTNLMQFENREVVKQQSVEIDYMLNLIITSNNEATIFTSFDFKLDEKIGLNSSKIKNTEFTIKNNDFIKALKEGDTVLVISNNERFYFKIVEIKENQNENQEENKIDKIKKQLLYSFAIETAKQMAHEPNKTEKEKETQEELLKEIKILEEQLQERLHNLNKELTFCQTMICILSAKDDE